VNLLLACFGVLLFLSHSKLHFYFFLNENLRLFIFKLELFDGYFIYQINRASTEAPPIGGPRLRYVSGLSAHRRIGPGRAF
jgi:hypothetical protein